ncbi:hypothetical protein NLJ89_g5319 [Agrocybe chaxingu]|uniref:Uncharacterized protein n=1 Tax=Agrocybe chaxingu TaxID=84603 RepID=A0A9W8JYS1_9AGAR|nr:hypothetical protein NLJ89_g5319 [Agrocybe chaxingu]
MEQGVAIEDIQSNTGSNLLPPSVSRDQVQAVAHNPSRQGQSLILVCMKTVGVQQDTAGPSSQPANQEVKQKPDREKPSEGQLAKLGVKVRDFAYESKLPPVRTIYLQPRQVQPSAPQGLQRQDTEENESFLQSQGARPLERTNTEPAAAAAPPSRTRGFLDLANYTLDSNNLDSQPPVVNPESRASIGPPEIVFESQDSDMLPNDTPIVTPNGSSQWDVEDINDIPASQLDTESQAPESEIVSYSQLGFSQPSELSSQPAPSQGDILLLNCSPLTPLPSSPSNAAPSPLALRKSTSSILSQSCVSSSNYPKAHSNSNTTTVTSPRYNLRKRTISAVSRHTPPKAPKRARVSILPGGSGTPTHLKTVGVQPIKLGKKAKGKETAAKLSGRRRIQKART